MNNNMIAKVFVVCLFLVVISAAPQQKDEIDIQRGRPGPLYLDGKVIPLQQQVPGPRQRRGSPATLAALSPGKEVPSKLTKDIPRKDIQSQTNSQ